MRCHKPVPLCLILLGAVIVLVPAACRVRTRHQPPAAAHQPPRPPKAEVKQVAVVVQPAPPRAPRQAAEAKRVDEVSWDVAGYGQTRELAEKDALAKAVKKVTDYLRNQKPPVAWTPSSEFVRAHLVRGEAERDEDKDQKLEKEEPGKEPLVAQCWVLHVSLTQADRDVIARLDADYRQEQRRQERAALSGERMLFLGRALVGLVAGLLALLAYLRLDEWTKGYYTRPLAVAAFGLAAFIALAVWIR
jgi:hypothetical protein